MSYPHVMGEDETLDIALSGRSIARVGEGELKHTVHKWDLKSQVYNPKLADETRALLAKPGPALVCLPRIWDSMPNAKFWLRFREERFTAICGPQQYGSAFITRSDVAHNIDRPDYWEKAQRLWAGKDVVLASHSPKVLNLKAAKSVRFVPCPPVGAYAEIDRIEEEIGRPSGPVLLVIGATATVLAARLANKGLYALDLGHLGSFMAAAGAFSVERATLISPAYAEQNRQMHKRGDYGGSGKRRRDDVMAYAAEIEAGGVLDYGCGQGTLKTSMVAAGFAQPIHQYDPGLKGLGGLPKPADLVTCTDVLEHIEPEKLTAVLAHIRKLALKAAYFVISTRKAVKSLPDGRNAHLLVYPAEWWLGQLGKAGFTIDRQEAVGSDFKVWAR